MDVEQKLRIRSNCSRGDIEDAIECLNGHYFSNSHRQAIAKLLKLCRRDGIRDDDTPQGHNIDGLLYTFEKSVYTIPRIPENKKEMARQLLISLRDAFNEEESDQDLIDNSTCLAKDISKIAKALIFHRCFSSGETFKPELRDILPVTDTIKISDTRKEITLFGEASEDDFWADLKKKYPSAERTTNLPSLTEFKFITTYCGNCPEP